MCDQKYQKSSKDFPSLENLPASSRFALCKQPSPSGANIASEPSRYSLATATGSKRSSADSDSLLCHVGLWQTSRLKFGCASVCEHSEIEFISAVPSARILESRPPCTFSGRADNACTNLLGFLVRYVRTRGIAEISESAKPPIFALPRAARTCHAWLARLTRARGRCFLRGRKALLNDFCRAFGHSKAREKKSYIMFIFSGISAQTPESGSRGFAAFIYFCFILSRNFTGTAVSMSSMPHLSAKRRASS